MDPVTGFLLELLAYGGGATTLAFLMFRFLGTQWIEARFAERLEAFKHAQARELAEMKVRIDSELSRAIRIQEKEFEVLSEAWVRLRDAVTQVRSAVSLLQSFPDLNRMTAPQFASFLESSRLQQLHKDELSLAPDKNKYYQETIIWYDLGEAQKLYADFRFYIQRSSIFLRPELKTMFENIDDLMWKAQISRKVGIEAKDGKFWEKAYDQMEKKVVPLVSELETKVHAVLHKGAV